MAMADKPPSIHLYSMEICPFVQRTRVLLALKGIHFEHTEMDPKSVQSDWFQKLNPWGKVPVIVHDGRVLYESLVINEFLEDSHPEVPLFPEDPYQRALARLLISYCIELIKAQYALQLNQDRAQDQALSEALLSCYRFLDDFLVRHNPDGVWAFDAFGMVDLTYAPFFARLCVNRYYRWFELPNSHEYARVLRWFEACVNHPLVKASGMPEEHYIKLYWDHARGYRRGIIPSGAQSAYTMAEPIETRPLPPRPPKPPFQLGQVSP